MIRLAVIDDRADKPVRYEFEMPYPATGLSVYTAVKIAMKRAREKGYTGVSREMLVYLGIKQVHERDGHSTHMQDNGPPLIVTIFPPAAKTEVWELD